MLYRLLFPTPARNFAGGRWVRISLRTLHLISMGFLMGGVALGAAPTDLPWALWGTLVTGLLFVAVELYTSFVWLYQLKGWAVICKIVLFYGALVAPDSALTLYVIATIIGGISSHMPGRFRYFSIFHGRVVKAD